VVTYYCCDSPNVGGYTYCPGDTTASGHTLTLADSGRLAACGGGYDLGQEVVVSGRRLTCLDRGNLAWNQVDAWFESCAEGREWVGNQ